MNSSNTRLNWRGFTLIELLIVIAIIAILALIAIPNFLEAQIRAKVSRVRGSMRSIAVALEAYYVDYNTYPTRPQGGGQPADMFGARVFQFHCLSSPIAYITDTYESALDPFMVTSPAAARANDTFGYLNRHGFVLYKLNTDPSPPAWAVMQPPYWFLVSKGPDMVSGPVLDNAATNDWIVYSEIENFYKKIASVNDIRLTASLYDPTNGTVSGGDLVRWGP